MQSAPDLDLERSLWHQGIARVAGVDEAGRGCLAGPVVAAAVVLAPDVHLPGVNDSKLLDPETREGLLVEINARAVAVGIGHCEPEEIDELNILWAAMEAMRRAVAALEIEPGCVLVDGDREIPGCPCPQHAVVGGDARSLSVAAASVVAKVTRDRIMALLDQDFPQYGFHSHKGYATASHYAALAAHGPCRHHRRSFRLA